MIIICTCLFSGDRLLNIDLPMSVGVMQPREHPDQVNLVEFVWDLDKEASVWIQVHCISTEFTARKHGGEKGVPFRIQIDSYALENNNELGQYLHSASCQIKVFKPKGADRKQKTDKDKMEKRSAPEKLKYQPSYDSTLLSECTPSNIADKTTEIIDTTIDVTNQPSTSAQQRLPDMVISNTNYSILANNTNLTGDRRNRVSGTGASGSFVSTLDNVGVATTVANINHIQSFSPDPKPASCSNYISCKRTSSPITHTLVPSSSVADTQEWLQRNRFTTFMKMFANFSGRDLLTLSRDDLTQICGRADGIRLFNALRVKALHPRLTIFLTTGGCDDGTEMDIYQAFYLERATLAELEIAINSCILSYNDMSVAPRINRVLYQPSHSNIHVLVTDEVVSVMKDESSFSINLLKNDGSDSYVVLLKS